MSSGQFPIAVPPVPRPRPFPGGPSSRHLSSPPAPLSGRLLCRKLRGARSKRRAEVAIYQFPGALDAPAIGDLPIFLSSLDALPQRPLMTLENRSSRSPAHCHSSLSHAPLIARYLSRRRLFTLRPGVLAPGRFHLLPRHVIVISRRE